MQEQSVVLHLLEYKEEDWDAVMELNLNSLFFLSQEAAKVMVEQKSGKIINIASMLSFEGGKFVPPYTASKHGVVGLTKAFTNELAEYGIQVNAIAPGYVKNCKYCTNSCRRKTQQRNS